MLPTPPFQKKLPIKKENLWPHFLWFTSMTVGSKVRPALPQEEHWSTSLPLQRQRWPGQGHVFTIWPTAGTAAGRLNHSWHTSIAMAMRAFIVCKHESFFFLFVFFFNSKDLAWYGNYTLYSQYKETLMKGLDSLTQIWVFWWLWCGLTMKCLFVQ